MYSGSKISINDDNSISLKHPMRGIIIVESPWSDENEPLRTDRIMKGNFIYFGASYLSESLSVALHFVNLGQSLSSYQVWFVCAETGRYKHQSEYKFNLGRRGFMEFTLDEVTDVASFARACIPFANDLEIYQFIKYVLGSERDARNYIDQWKPDDSRSDMNQISGTPAGKSLRAKAMIIYNHNYARNIPLLDSIYRPRFSDVLHVLPNISPSHSRCLHAPAGSYQYHLLVYHGLKYIVTKDLLSDGLDWLLVVQDDVLVHPRIDGPFLADMLDPHRNVGAFPSKSFSKNIPDDTWTWNERINLASLKPRNPIGGNGFEGFMPFFQSAKYSRGVSDIFIIHRSHVPEFCELLGFYVSQNVFPEVAIPTVLNMICTNNNKSLADIDGTYLWFGDRKLINSDTWLKEKFYSTQKIFLHPVKPAKQNSVVRSVHPA